MRVTIETPYRGVDKITEQKHIHFARLCLVDSLARGEHPLASHLLYPQVLDDRNPIMRARGLEAGLNWLEVADRVVLYTNLGISPGMREAAAHAMSLNIRVEYRKLDNYDAPVVK